MGGRRITKTRMALRAVIFVLIAVLGIGLISPAFIVNNEWDMRHVHGFFLEPEDSLDVVLIGASQLYTGYSAPLAWQDYGFTSYPLTVSNIPARLYGSLLTEAVNRQHPKLIVVDIDGFINDEDMEKLEANLRKWIDNMPWSRNRIETIRTCVPAELQSSFYFNIAKYHANWYQVDSWLPVQRRLRAMDKTGYSLSKGVETVCKSLPADFVPDVRPLTLSGANAQYLRDFCAQVQSIGTDVLFLRTPHRTQTTDPNVFADVAAVVGEYGYELLDLHDAFDTIGLDRCADFIDSDHLNTIGMEKFTVWFGQYLTGRYDLTGTHSEAVTAEWERCADFAAQTLPLCKELAAENTNQNLNEFSAVFEAYR